jgi:membrane protein implicated in regulation of membrane protease activity
MKVIKAIYNFIVGDMIILVGIIIALIILALINTISALAPLRVATGWILVISVLAVLTSTLYREARGNR